MHQESPIQPTNPQQNLSINPIHSPPKTTAKIRPIIRPYHERNTLHFNSSPQKTKKFVKDLRSQGSLSGFNYKVSSYRSAFKKTHLSSKLRTLSSSISSIHFDIADWSKFDPSFNLLLKSLVPLKNLSHFQIHFDYFSSKTPKFLHRIFHSLLRLTKLTHLTLTFSGCLDFDLLHFKVLSLFLTKLPRLRSLQLGFEQTAGLGDQGILHLVSTLSNLKKLTQFNLDLSGVRIIQSSTLLSLFTSLQAMENLSDLTLNLSKNTIQHKGTNDPLAEGLTYLNSSKIQRLSFNLHVLMPSGLRKISEALKRFTLLKDLSLNCIESRMVMNEGVQDLSSALSSLNSLSSLSLFFLVSSANGDTVKNIAFALKNLQNLTHLKFNLRVYHEIPKDQFEELSSSLQALPLLRSLDISMTYQNPQSNNALEYIAESLQELICLKDLVLEFSNSCKIASKEAEVLGGALKRLENLTDLTLKLKGDEDVDEKVVEIIAQALNYLPSLYSVTFGFVKFAKYIEQGNEFAVLLEVLKQKTSIRKVCLDIPCSKDVQQKIRDLRKSKIVL